MRRIIKKKFRRFWKSAINRRLAKLAARFSLVIFMLAAILSFGKIPGTNSFFMDTAGVEGNTMTAGYWIPTLTMSVDPSSPDGDNGWYVTSPCVSLEAKLGGVTASLTEVDIYYEFSNDGNPADGGSLYDGTCVSIPDGNPTQFQAIAVNVLNSDWKSNIVSGQFKVDTQCPFVKITNPNDSATLSNSVEVRGTVTDANPHHYWLVIENSSGTTVAGPGTVNDTNSFTNKKFFDWDTTSFADGDYTIKLEARDQAGNKCPNLAPVLADPENPNDSVDWIDVTVNNTATVTAGDVVINEVMWMGSDGDFDDEWIELKNTTGHDIDLSNWDIENGGSGSGHIEIPHGYKIKASEFFLITRKKWNETKINLGSDLNNDQGYTHVSGMSLYNDGEKLTLEDNYNNVIDTAWKDSGSWPEGTNNTLKQSMERNDTPSDGTLAGSWHTCVDEHCNDTTYWDSEGNNYGTPGHNNLSENDSSENGVEELISEDVVQEEPVITGAENAVVDEIPEEVAPADEVVADPVLEGEEPVAETEDEPQIITKEFDIKLSGKLDVPDGFEAEVSQKMKKIELSGEESAINDLKDFEIDLAKIEIKKEESKIEILVSDLDLPKDVKVLSHESDDVVLEIVVSEKKEDSQDGGKDESKKDEVKSAGGEKDESDGKDEEAKGGGSAILDGKSDNSKDDGENSGKDKDKDKDKGDDSQGKGGENNTDNSNNESK